MIASARTVIRRGLAAMVLVPLLVVGTADDSRVAVAHSALARITPANGSTVRTAVGEVVLMFNEKISAPSVTVSSVADPTGRGQVVRGASRKVVTFTPSAPLGNGNYTVRWRVRSADGHVVSGVSRFSVRIGS